MNTLPRRPSAAAEAETDEAFDQASRACHTQSLDQLSPRARARLRAARQAAVRPAPARRGFGWALAGGMAVLALVATLQLQRPPTAAGPEPQLARAPVPSPPMPRPGTGLEPDDEVASLLAALDENPDFYLWLASSDDALPPPPER